MKQTENHRMCNSIQSYTYIYEVLHVFTYIGYNMELWVCM